MKTKKLKILLVSPKGQFLFKNSAFANYVENSREMQTILHYWNGMGVALQTIAGLTPGDHDITIIDENFDNINFDEFYDIVGISAMTQQAVRAYEIAKEFKKRNRYVVMGGIHATVMPEEAQKYVDTLFVGESENTWPIFINDFINQKQKRTYNQNNYKPVDMTKIPLPRYDLVSKYKYPVIWVQSTRGCPHDCEFCAASLIYGRKYKHKNVDQVVNEIKELRKYWKFTQIGFADDNMFVNRKYVKELISEFKKMRFTWYAQTDISVAQDVELLQGLYESGCRILFIGFESVSKRSIANIDKNHWKEKMFEKYEKYIDIIQRNGIGIYGSFILGLDEDKPGVVDSTIDFINRNHIMGIQVTILTPFPGSRLRTRFEQENRIISNDWALYTAWNAVINHKLFKPDELEHALTKIYESVYNSESYKNKAIYFKKICEDLINKRAVV